jgi:hypothetical protein
MFFKKQTVNPFSKWGPLTEIAWDDETVKWIAESERLSVEVTHILKTVSLGQTRTDGEVRHRSEWEVYGVMTRPKFIPVDIAFDNGEGEQFGGFSYDRRDNQSLNGTHDFNLPFLRLWLSDRDGQKAQLIYEALRHAILSGKKCKNVRFWKKKGDGFMTEVDKEHGWSYQSRYPILGMVAWPELQAVGLPKWAIPADQTDFSLGALPRFRSDLDNQLVG